MIRYLPCIGTECALKESLRNLVENTAVGFIEKYLRIIYPSTMMIVIGTK
jgi:hypothetical protein